LVNRIDIGNVDRLGTVGVGQVGVLERGVDVLDRARLARTARVPLEVGAEKGIEGEEGPAPLIESAVDVLLEQRVVRCAAIAASLASYTW
jgi:hypothetical protein